MTVTLSFAAMLLASTPASAGAAPLPVQDASALPAPVSADGKPTAPLAAPAIAEPAPTPPPPLVRTVSPAEHASHESDIVVRARRKSVPGDPFQGANVKSFEVTQAVDQAVVRPVARGYQRIIPDPIRSGIRNIINNLREPVVFLNFMLQLKPGKAAETVARFAVNTTVGVGGAFDMAKRKPFRLPRRPNGLGNTLGYYGVGPGPFFFLPLIGPTSLRDLIGDNVDRLVLPVVVGKPFNKPLYAIAIGTFSSLDQRAEYDEKLQELRESTGDPYTARREDYLRSRQNSIDALHSQKWRDAHPRADTSPPIVGGFPNSLAPVTPPH
ncbi:hypothetical protein BH09PSE3_BH09PSE3_11020 [soil metagenome]